MFNQMTPAAVVKGIGAVLREAAQGDESGSEFDRAQLLSAYSASRHLAVELSTYEPELRRFVAEVEGPGIEAEELDPRRLGEALAALLAELRADPSPQARERLRRIRVALSRLIDREVELLAEGLS